MSDEREDGEGQGGFLSRWSRRKRAERAGDADPAAPPLPAESPEPEISEPELDPDALTPEEVEALPPVESVATREELQVFLRKGVPAPLRNAALRRIWMLNPKIANYLDVARDYAYDWNTPGGVPGSGGTISPAAALAMAEKFLAAKPVRDKLESQQADQPAGGDQPISTETAEAAPEVPLEGENPQDQTLVVEEPVEAAGLHDSAMQKPALRRHGGAKPR